MPLLEKAVAKMLEFPHKVSNSVIHLAEYLRIRRKRAQFAKLFFGRLLKISTLLTDLDLAIDRFFEQPDQANWQLVVSKMEPTICQIEKFMKNLPDKCPGEHFKILDTITEILLREKSALATVLEYEQTREANMEQIKHGLRLCQNSVRRLQKQLANEIYEFLGELCNFK